MQNRWLDRILKTDVMPPYRHQLHDVEAGNSIHIEAVPAPTKFAAGRSGLIGAGAVATAIAGMGEFNSCTKQPIAFRFGESATAEMGYEGKQLLHAGGNGHRANR